MPENWRNRGFAAACMEAGLIMTEKVDGKKVEKPKYVPYDLRHFYASVLIASRTDLKTIQSLMGHEDIKTTLNVYGHLLKRADENSAQRGHAFFTCRELMWQICGETVKLSCIINGFYSLSRKRSRVQVPSLAPFYFQALSRHFIFRSAANQKIFATNTPRLKPAEFRHSLICSLWRCGEFVAILAPACPRFCAGFASGLTRAATASSANKRAREVESGNLTAVTSCGEPANFNVRLCSGAS